MKLAVVLPAATPIEAGMVSKEGLLLASETFAPLLGAPKFSVTMQVELAPGGSWVGLQTSELKTVGPAREIVAVVVLPLYIAVTVTA